MKNNVDQMYAPLLLLKKITARYPNCWELVEKLRIHDDVSSSYPVWEPWCYIPIGGTLAITHTYQLLQDVLQLVLYVCANNADVQPNPEQQSTTTNSRVIKDRYVEIRKWDVGVCIGDAIRAMTSTQPVNHQEKKPGTHASPRPHMRRGHWHYFWTGSKSEPSERKLVLRWVAPMPIGITGGDTPVVLHRVT